MRFSNKIFLTEDELQLNSLFSLVFRNVDTPQKFPAYLIELVIKIIKLLSSKNNKSKNDFLAEVLSKSLFTLKRLETLLVDVTINYSFETLFRLLRNIFSGLSIPFSGEPLQGMQILGMLETRCIDFENIIVLSMNEGVFPKSGKVPTAVPLSLRYGFGLPVPDHQEAIFAYYFYRNLQHCKSAVLVYNSKSDGLTAGERSTIRRCATEPERFPGTTRRVSRTPLSGQVFPGTDYQ